MSDDLIAAQQKYIQESVFRKQATSITVPTDVVFINAWFREIGEPIIIFGESLVDRRQRLGLEIAKRGGLDALPRLKASPSSAKTVNKQEDLSEQWWGRRHGGDNIIELRKRLTDYWFKNKSTSIIEYDLDHRLADIELIGANIVGSRPSTSIAILEEFIAVSDRNGDVSLLQARDLTPIYFVNVQSVGHLCSYKNILLCSGQDGAIRIYNNHSRHTNLMESAHNNSRVFQTSMHPSGSYFASCAADSYWRFWDIESHLCLFEHRGHHPNLGIRCVAIDKHGGSLVATGGGDGAMRIWDIRIGKCIMTGIEHVQGVTNVDSINACLFISGGLDNKIVGWDLRQAERPVYTLPAHTSAVTGLRFVDEHRFASCSLDCNVKLWHTSGKQSGSLAVSTDAKLFGLTCEFGQKQLFTCGLDKTIRNYVINDI